MCEVFNMILLFFNFWATDQFLQGRFRYYGYQVSSCCYNHISRSQLYV